MQSSANIETGYKNLVDCAVGVVNTQGVTGLYRGFGASIGTSAPSSAIFFATYEAVKKWTEVKFPHSLGKVGPIVAAAVGNVVASVVRVPPEVRGLLLCCAAHLSGILSLIISYVLRVYLSGSHFLYCFRDEVDLLLECSVTRMSS
jgi:hypothetical protein